MNPGRFNIGSPDFFDHPNNIIVSSGPKCRTPKLALEEAKVTPFRLRATSPVSFFILDDYRNNAGGLTPGVRGVVEGAG
jgi:hypothetical protein